MMALGYVIVGILTGTRCPGRRHRLGLWLGISSARPELLERTPARD